MKKLIFCLMLFCFGYQGLVFSQDYDEQTKKALEAKYSYVFYDEDGNCFKVLLNGKYGICDLIGKEIIAPDKYTRVGTYGVEDGYYYVAIGDKEGILDLTGREIIATDKYTRAFFMDMYGGYLAVEQNGKSGVCDLTGKEIVPCKYDNVVFYGEYYGVTLNDKEGACDLTGQEIVPCIYNSIVYSDGFKYKNSSGSWVLIEGTPLLTETDKVNASTSSSLSETEESTPANSSSGSNAVTTEPATSGYTDPYTQLFIDIFNSAPVLPIMPTTPIYYQQTQQQPQQQATQQVECPVCHGFGKVCYLKSVATYGQTSTVKQRCPVCSELLSFGDYHEPHKCTRCQGSGYIQR